MRYVYVLKSVEKERSYVGVTADIGRRLKEHNAGEVKSTKAYRPYEVVHQEVYASLTEARRRESFLKTSSGRKELQKIFEINAERCRSG